MAEEMRGHGRRVWVIPDGELPPKGEGRLKGMSLCLFSTPRRKKLTFC